MKPGPTAAAVSKDCFLRRRGNSCLGAPHDPPERRRDPRYAGADRGRVGVPAAAAAALKGDSGDEEANR